MSQHLFHYRTRPGGVLLVYAKRGLFVLGLVRPSETLRYIMQLLIALMVSCARDIHMLCLEGIQSYLSWRGGILLSQGYGRWLLAMLFWPMPSCWIAPRVHSCFLSLIGLA